MRRLGCGLAIAVLALSAACSGPGSKTLEAEFADVGDLVTRANVQQADTRIGTVRSIRLVGWTARVTMSLSPGARVPEGTRAVVRSTSLLGEKFIDLQAPADATKSAPSMQDGELIPLERTDKTPEVEQVFEQLGAILASGALADLGAVTTATARIVEGQEDHIGEVLDGTARLISSLSSQRVSIANAFDTLSSASSTFAANTQTAEKFLATTAQVGSVLAAQRVQLQQLVTQLDRLGQVSGPLLTKHKQDVDSTVKSLIAILPQLVSARADLDTALTKLPTFSVFFAAVAPGDYIRLDVATESPLPAGTTSLAAVFRSATS